MVVDGVDGSRFIVVVAFWVNVEVVGSVVVVVGSMVVVVGVIAIVVVVVGFVVEAFESLSVEVVNSFTTVLEQSANRRTLSYIRKKHSC